MHTRIKTLSVIVGVFGLLCSGLFFKTALASSYEWISSFWAPQDCCHIDSTRTVSWQTSTSNDWEEYRTVYYGTSTGAAILPTQWTEFQQCRKQGNINGTGPVDSCNITIPNNLLSSSSASGTTPYFWTKATTNYSGCGTWTSDPGENCGDAINSGAPYKPRVTCTKSDSQIFNGVLYKGPNRDVFGTSTSTDHATGQETVLSDVCDGDNVREAWCNEDGTLVQDAQGVSCGVGTTCVNGHCQY